MFLPEQTQQPQAGVASVTPANPETTTADIALMQRVLAAASRNPNLIPADFMAYMVDFIQTSRLSIPIGQVFGFSQYTAQVATPINTAGTIATTVAGDCTDAVGPSLTGLPDGKYIVMFGGGCQSPTAGHSANIGFSVNGGAVDVNNVAWTHTTNFVAAAHISTATLNAGGANSIVLKYFSGTALDTTTYTLRWLVALKYANA